jgi:hypothetical protein
MYKGVNLKLATQRDLSKVLNLPIVLVSFEKNLSEEQERIAGLFAFAENYNLHDLLSLLESIYP